METIKQNYLGNLNKNQEEAIINIEGPCLIVAGAGVVSNGSATLIPQLMGMGRSDRNCG